MSDDLKILFPGRDVEVTVRKGKTGVKETIFVAPFSLAVIGKVSGLVREVLPSVEISEGNYLRLIQLASEPLLEMLAVCVDRPPEFFKTILPDDGIKLISAMIEENMTFFIQNIAPQLDGMTKAMGMLLPSDQESEKSATSPSSSD